MNKTFKDRTLCFKPSHLLILCCSVGVSLYPDGQFLAQMSSAGAVPDPADSAFGMTDPVTTSLRATEQLGNRFQEEQHRLQPDSNHRQLRARRPEPGESEVTREEEIIPLKDPLRSTLRNILPRDR